MEVELWWVRWVFSFNLYTISGALSNENSMKKCNGNAASLQNKFSEVKEQCILKGIVSENLLVELGIKQNSPRRLVHQ